MLRNLCHIEKLYLQVSVEDTPSALQERFKLFKKIKILNITDKEE